MRRNPTLLESIRCGLSAVLNENINLQWIRDLPGGDINRAALIGDGSVNWFVKYKQGAPDGMFVAEAAALNEIIQQECIRVPSAIAHGNDEDTAWLVLEHLELTSSGPDALLGEQLAALHAVNMDQFGWQQDNYIGTSKQKNTSSKNWTDFWCDNRIRPQIKMAETAGYGIQLVNKTERLLESMNYFMEDQQPAASLLHGDLWAGNKAFTPTGQPVIFDPASYYGDRETDIAMTELFGGFGAEFYSAYNATSPLPDGYQLRRDLYNLYHMLNHLNLFGAGYLGRCENIIDHLLAQIR